MRKGIFIPANVVRTAVGVFAAALVAMTLFEAPEVRRYIKLKTM